MTAATLYSDYAKRCPAGDNARIVSCAEFKTRGGIKRMPAALTCAISAGRIEVATPSGELKPLRLDTVTPDERRRLVIYGSDGTPIEPAALWLSEVGLPVAPNSWEVIFIARTARKCLASRAMSVHTAVRNCTRDEGGPFGFGDQVADPKPPRAAAVKAVVVNLAKRRDDDPGGHGPRAVSPARP
jgi:hypothetical protein